MQVSSKQPLHGLVFIVLLVSSCTSRPRPPVATPTATLPQSTPTPNATYGVTVKVIDACSDGIRTTLHLQTELDTKYWGLNASDFDPLGDVYFETSTVFLENGQLFSSTSSGERAGPFFDLLSQMARADQKFVYPAVPSPNSQFMLRAEVTLANLPSNYKPPTAGVTFIAPDTITIPAQFNLPVIMSACK